MTLKLVLFDCDGVLVDSEPVAAEIASQALGELGWPVPPADCIRLFTGRTLADIMPLVREHVPDVPDDWLPQLAARLLAALSENAEAMAGAADMLRATTELGLPWRVASNSNRREMAAKFRATGLAPLIGDRYHSASDVARGKPAPDLFLLAALAGQTDPAHCLVVEDSLPGVQAAVAAGIPCVGFAPQDGAHLQNAGARHLVRHLSELPALFAAQMAT